MAKCFTMDLSIARTRAVQAYFAKFSVLPTSNIRVDTTVNIVGPPSFENLIRRVAADSAQDFVLVVHGDPNGDGLLLPLANGRTMAQARATGKNLKVLNDIAGKKGVISPADRSNLSLDDGQINRLLALRDLLHKKKMRVIEFRGCNLGRSALSMQQFRAFFGAPFGAPDLYSFFGEQPAKSGSSVMCSHASTHQGTTYTYTSDYGGKKCLCCIGVDLITQKPVNGHLIADDDPTIDRWIQDKLSVTGTKGNAKSVPIHGLWLLRDENDPDPLSPPRPIFPLAVDGKKRNEYSLHTQYFQ